MQNKFLYKSLFSGSIDVTVKTALSILESFPASQNAFLRIAGGLKEAEQKREKFLEEGTEVPPLMIVSTTDSCNLACAGCYACAKSADSETLTQERICGVLNEASELGVGIVMLAGGEPLLSPAWMNELGEHPELLGILFSNGTLLNKERIAFLDRNRHIIPALSIEGGEEQTDARRGSGVYALVSKAMSDFHVAGLPFGVSITITSGNINNILTPSFIEEYISKGVRLFIFVEYVPAEPGSEPLVLSKDEKHRLSSFCQVSGEKYGALFIAFPGDEDRFGGCLAAGRGFIHISSSGRVEPCPFAPFTDTSLKDMGLKEALSSEFLAKIRENHHLLKEGDGGCALWSNKEWLSTL